MANNKTKTKTKTKKEVALIDSNLELNNPHSSSPWNYQYLVLLSFLGLYLSDILKLCGILSGKKGIKYYAEAHLSKWNSWMHTIGMPFTFYGISCWVPALLSIIRILSKYDQSNMQLSVWYVYIIHYMTIDVKRALLCIIFYVYPAYRAYKKTTNETSKSTFSNFKLFLHGFIISFLSLLFQETVGHYIGGDIPSRPEGVLNAILYSVIFSTYHIM